jgi:hypothetical protein
MTGTKRNIFYRSKILRRGDRMTYEVSWKDGNDRITLEVYGDIYKAIERTTDLQLNGKEVHMIFLPDLTKVKADPIQILIDEFEQNFLVDFYERRKAK